MSAKWRWWIAIAALPLLVGGLYVYAEMKAWEELFASLPKPRSFDAEVWRSAREADSEDMTRLEMIEDLLAKHPLEGRDRSSVEALLGPPCSDPYAAVREPDAEPTTVYRLGPDFLDARWLELVWNEDDVVVRAFLWTD